MQYLKFLMVLLIASSVSCSPGKKLAKNPESELKNQIREMITMLEAGQYLTFIKTYAHPEDLDELEREENLEELAKVFGEIKAQLLLSSLMNALEEEPEFNEEKTKAVFVPADMGRSLILERVDDQWYIRN